MVLLHETNALEAASIASFVSSKPISGTVPSSSFVAGSSKNSLVNGWEAEEVRVELTEDGDLFPIFCIDPFAVDEALEFYKVGIF